MRLTSLCRSDALYPDSLRTCLGEGSPERIVALGDLNILHQKTLALFCSVKCPGNLILQTYDLAQQLRDGGITVISGFQSPMEQECLDLLLRGKQPVIACSAKRLPTRRLPGKYVLPVREGRLLLLSPFGEKVRRATADTARLRNELVAALADQVFVAYAAPGSKTEALCRKALGWGKPLFTFDSSENKSLLALGVLPCGSDALCQGVPVSGSTP